MESAGPATATAPAPAAARSLHRLWSEWIQFGEPGALVLSSRQPPLVELRRAAVIVSRVRIVAALFAVLTLAWIPVDALVLPPETAIRLALARAFAGAAFAWLAVSFAGRHTTMRGAYAGLALMYAIPMCLYVLAIAELHAPNTGITIAEPLFALYSFIPVIAVMGLSLFPLTIVEVLAFAAPVILGDALAGWFGPWADALGARIAGHWMLLMTAAIAALACASQLGLMLALMRQAMRDLLTHCFSRATTEALLELQFGIAERSAAPLSVAFVDLDNFKSVNDAHGHEAGDAVLLAAAERLRAGVRRTDVVGRWGGEEFVVLLPHATLDASAVVLERIRAGGFGLCPDGRPMTASIGLAEKIRDGAPSWRALVEAADARMFQAKRAGKDRLAVR